MHQNHAIQAILDGALAGRAPSREESVALLTLPEHSPEARHLMAVADQVTRVRFGNDAVLFGQIGVETAPCPGECDFCTFNRKLGRATTERLSVEEVVDKARAFTASGDLFALFLMTMHNWDVDLIEATVRAVRDVIPGHTKLVVNVGDFGLDRGKRLRDLGVSGAYHVRRLGEGRDTALRPESRLRTYEVIRESGLDLYTCVEPIGPEHGPEELAEQMWLGVDAESFQHAAMRRVSFDGSPLAARGMITNLRLAQITAVVALTSLRSRRTTNIAVHEPNLLGLVSGANAIYAEAGANPRDLAKDTSQSRGFDVTRAKQMLRDAGFTRLRRGDGSHTPLESAGA